LIEETQTEEVWTVHHGDALEWIRSLPNSSADSIVSDPPAGIAFMGKKWDSDKGGRDLWIAWLAEILKAARRVLKPGGHILIWALPRTSHWTGTAIEDAGYEARNVVFHHFGNGFPKSLDVSKAIDKKLGAAREQVRHENPRNPKAIESGHGVEGGDRPWMVQAREDGFVEKDGTEAVTEEAKQWNGYGTDLKPATEMWWLARKPLEGTVATNVLEHGTGGLNIDGCRVGTSKGVPASARRIKDGTAYGNLAKDNCSTAGWNPNIGRWPTNLILTHSAGCRSLGPRKVKSTGIARRGKGGGDTFGGENKKPPMEDHGYADADGLEEVEAFACEADCPILQIDEQSGATKSTTDKNLSSKKTSTWFAGGEHQRESRGDSGGASRFFPNFLYSSKPSRKEKEAGCELLPEKERRDGTKNSTPRSEQIYEAVGREGKPRKNSHPTVKGIELMRWLCRMITPPGGLVLDPFCGSGTTGIGAYLEGFRFAGCDQDEESVEIARARLSHWQRESGSEPVSSEGTETPPWSQTNMF